MNGKMKGMVEGILLGLCSKGSFQIAEIFTGLASGLEYLFDQNTLRLDIVDSGAAGDSFSMAGDTLTISLQTIAPTQTVAFDMDNEVWTDLTFDEFKELCESGDFAIVEYNDTTYECMMRVCLDSAVMDYVYVIGNAVLAPDRVGGHVITDTGEPFVLTWGPGERLPILQCDLDQPSACTISIYISDKPVIRFMYRESIMLADKGMTWAEWINSEYNTTDIFLSTDNLVTIKYDVEWDEYTYLHYETGADERALVHGDDLIVKGGIYW